jgi:hypothetical protein
MDADKKKIHTRHERWCTHFALQLCGRVSPHRVLRQHLVVDASVHLDTTKDLWTDLTPYLVHREVLVEHFSNSVNVTAYANCVSKIGFMLQSYTRVPLKERGELKAPSLVMLSHRRPDRLLREPGLFESTQTSGIWVRRPIEMGAMFLVATTHLPEDSRYDWLRISTRIPETADGFRMAETLMRKQELARVKELELEELMMDFYIDGKTPVELMAELKEERLLRRAAEEQRLSLEEQRLAAERAEAQIRAQMDATQREIEELKAQIRSLKNQR